MLIFWRNDSLVFRSENEEERRVLSGMLRNLGSVPLQSGFAGEDQQKNQQKDSNIVDFRH